MRPLPISKKQFVSWLVVFTIGMAVWTSPIFWSIGVVIIAFGNLTLMTPQERSRPVPGGELLWMFGGLLVLAALMFAAKRWVPDDFGARVARVIQHPAVAAVLWALVVWLTYRRYRATKVDAQAHGTNFVG
jgi:hypothetical protein